MVCRSSGVRPDQLLDVGEEAEVEHLVGLVEHEHLDVAEIEVTLLARSSSRPGVPTTTSTPARSVVDLRLVGATAVEGEHAGAARLPAVSRSPVTWTASSRVGTMTRACGLPASTMVA